MTQQIQLLLDVLLEVQYQQKVILSFFTFVKFSDFY